MKSIILGNQELKVKDYYCNVEGEYTEYPPKQDGKLWLYVNLTNDCNGSCPFCINPCVGNDKNTIDTRSFQNNLKKIRDHVSGISITGGEPMLFPELINEALRIIHEECGCHIEIDLATNGMNFIRIPDILDLHHIDSIHLSRHMITDEENNRVFGFPTISLEELSSVIKKMDDPAQIVLNCVLMSGGIDSVKNMAQYLDSVSEIGIRNVSFIGLSRHNSYCKEHYIDPEKLNIFQDPRFHKWNALHDHDYCSCCSGSYDAPNSSIRFYYRRMGKMKAHYLRNLVYTADNRLLGGFSGMEISFNEDI